VLGLGLGLELGLGLGLRLGLKFVPGLGLVYGEIWGWFGVIIRVVSEITEIWQSSL